MLGEPRSPVARHRRSQSLHPPPYFACWAGPCVVAHTWAHGVAVYPVRAPLPGRQGGGHAVPPPRGHLGTRQMPTIEFCSSEEPLRQFGYVLTLLQPFFFPSLPICQVGSALVVWALRIFGIPGEHYSHHLVCVPSFAHRNRMCPKAATRTSRRVIIIFDTISSSCIIHRGGFTMFQRRSVE